MLKETNACVGRFHSGMMPIEEVDAQKVFELDHPLADAGLANAKRLRGAAETEVLRDRQGLDLRGQFNFRVHENPLKRWGRLMCPRQSRALSGKRESLKKMRASPMRWLSIDEYDAA